MALFGGAMALGIGLPRVLAPRRSFQLSRQDHAKRIAEIEAGAPEQFHEEYRSLKAYPPTNSERAWLLFGWVATVAGLAAIAMGLVGKQAFLGPIG